MYEKVRMHCIIEIHIFPLLNCITFRVRGAVRRVLLNPMVRFR